jgi:hypothetical protein
LGAPPKSNTPHHTKTPPPPHTPTTDNSSPVYIRGCLFIYGYGLIQTRLEVTTLRKKFMSKKSIRWLCFVLLVFGLFSVQVFYVLAENKSTPHENINQNWGENLKPAKPKLTPTTIPYLPPDLIEHQDHAPGLIIGGIAIVLIITGGIAFGRWGRS